MLLPITFFENKMTRDILQRAQDHERIRSYIMNNSINMLFSFLTFLVFGAILFVNADIGLLVVCSPYCLPCAKAHKEIERLIEIYSNQTVITIRFNVESDARNSIHNTTINQIVDAYKQCGGKVVGDWFTIMNLKKWQERYSFTDEANDKLLVRYQDFCTKANNAYPYLFY